MPHAFRLIPYLLRTQNAMEGWAEFTREVQQYYGVDMACLGDQFRREQKGARCMLHVMPHVLSRSLHGAIVTRACIR
jgi:hypothetical protein